RWISIRAAESLALQFCPVKSSTISSFGDPSFEDRSAQTRGDQACKEGRSTRDSGRAHIPTKISGINSSRERDGTETAKGHCQIDFLTGSVSPFDNHQCFHGSDERECGRNPSG